MNLLSLTPEMINHDKATEQIKNMLPDIFNSINYNIKRGIPYHILHEATIETNDNLFLAGYDPITKTIHISNKATVSDLIHEIGHVIHHQLFNYKEFSLSEIGKTEYAYHNHKEDFAEAFADFVIINKETIRNRQIKDILNTL